MWISGTGIDTLKNLYLYLLKNLGQMILVLFAVSVLCFMLVSISPVDPVRMFVGEVGMQNMAPETLSKLRSYFGTDTPAATRYFVWLGDVVRGNMGMSLIYRQPVTQVIAARFVNSFALMLSAWILSGVLGFVLGIIAGVMRDRPIDRLIKGYSFVLASTPTFWLALVALMVFAVWLKIFPIGLSVPIGVDASQVTIFDSLRHLVLPAFVLSITGVANIALHTREKVIDIMEEDYVLYAKARGMRTLPIVMRHGLRNVVLPAITLQFASISEIFGGSVLVEQVFSYPGLGQAAIRAGLGGDAPLLLGVALIGAALVYAGNTTANILYGVIDPRIRRGSHD
jgi:peptide/nickel transport system permease protein